MTALPFASESFDAAYATESLEHAVDIEGRSRRSAASSRPGGRIVIIDKNAEHWGRLKTPEWEKWFRRAELEKLLWRHCRTSTANSFRIGRTLLPTAFSSPGKLRSSTATRVGQSTIATRQ